jgi:hypothetical protein
MTNEETIRHLEDLQRLYLDNEKFTADIEAIEIAIEALKKQPCEDCVSRKLLSDNICEGISCNECSFNEIDGECGCLLQKRFDELPSVQPTRPTGHWIVSYPDGARVFKCNQCNKYADIHHATDYCPNCGAKMQEEEDER